MKGRKPSITVASGAVQGNAPAPLWMSRLARAEWRRVIPELTKRRILTLADLGSLESYCVAIGRVREIELQLRAGFDLKLNRAQDAAMKTARQLAAELGLTPVSRNRPAVRDNDTTDDDDNPLSV